MTKWIFCLLIHLPNQINQFPQVSIHSLPQHTAWCHCLYTMYFLGYFCISVSHSRKARPHGMWCGTRFTHFIHNTQDYNQTSQLSICHYSIITVPTPITLLLAMLLLTLFSSVHVQTVFFPMSLQRVSVVLKASVLNSKLARTKVHSTHNTFQWCFWC